MSFTELHITIIEPGRFEENYWRDLWRYRELLHVLAWRDVAIRYKQTAIGIAWAVIRPVLTMAIFTVVFSRLAKLPSDGDTPYPLMVFAGMLPWTLFSSAFADSSNSLVSSSHLISKVYFPRLILPTATVMSALIDFAVNFVLLIGMLAWYHCIPTWKMLLLPAFIVAAILASLGPGVWIAALNVKYRDFRHLLPFLVQLGVYVSPIGYSSAIVPARWRLLYSLNPMVYIIDGFRWCILGRSSHMYWPGCAVGLVVMACFLWLGAHQFRKTERKFADLI